VKERERDSGRCIRTNAVARNTLQHTATHCNTLQHTGQMHQDKRRGTWQWQAPTTISCANSTAYMPPSLSWHLRSHSIWVKRFVTHIRDMTRSCTHYDIARELNHLHAAILIIIPLNSNESVRDIHVWHDSLSTQFKWVSSWHTCMAWLTFHSIRMSQFVTYMYGMTHFPLNSNESVRDIHVWHDSLLCHIWECVSHLTMCVDMCASENVCHITEYVWMCACLTMCVTSENLCHIWECVSHLRSCVNMCASENVCHITEYVWMCACLTMCVRSENVCHIWECVSHLRSCVNMCASENVCHIIEYVWMCACLTMCVTSENLCPSDNVCGYVRVWECVSHLRMCVDVCMSDNVCHIWEFVSHLRMCVISDNMCASENVCHISEFVWSCARMRMCVTSQNFYTCTHSHQRSWEW